MEITTSLDFIKDQLGSTVGNSFTLIVSIIAIYGFLVKTGIIEHISLIATYKQRKKDKLIANKEKLITESRLDSKTKDNVAYHQNVLYLQKELGIEEKNLNKLIYLNGIIEREKGIATYELCKDVFTFNKDTQKLVFKDEINPKNANKNRIIGIILYVVICVFSFWVMFYIKDTFKDSTMPKKELLFLIVLSASALLSGVYFAFKVLTYFMKLKNAEWLLQMERIEDTKISSESSADIINNLEPQP
ncbi:hypothetical protein [Acinetobacter lactucae]|uniref:hypothetical protein n=1 Tax=Acinetobacter lactucae TaxID=1785128 RepID=UPI000F77F4FD|nr:hypothetical protein [Acinetobacter lactucae]RSO37466.1 hypothetical protein EA763_05030 [Acinetobacter lactucae]